MATGRLVMLATCEANCSELSDSSRSAADGERHTMSNVRALPPNVSCNNRVSFESQYGTWLGATFEKKNSSFRIK